MSELSKSDIRNLSISERIVLIGELWNSIIEVPEQLALAQAQKEELDYRLARLQNSSAKEVRCPRNGGGKRSRV